MQCLDLVHHVFIDGETAGGIDDHHIRMQLTGFTNGSVGNVHRVFFRGGRHKQRPHFAGQGFQLLDGGWSVHIGTGYQHLFLFPFLQVLGQLAHRGGFTRPLQARHQNHRRWLHIQFEGVVGIPHHVHQFLVHDLDEHLARAQALHDLLPDGTLLHLVDECLHHRQGNVCLQQGHSDFPQGLFDVVLGETRLAGYTAQAATEAFGQVIKHNSVFIGC